MDKNYIASELVQAAKEVQAVNGLPPEIARLERKFDSAIQDILGGISDYRDVMEKLSRMRDNPDAVRIGKRGVDTATQRLKSWRAIADDLFSLSVEE